MGDQNNRVDGVVDLVAYFFYIILTVLKYNETFICLQYAFHVSVYFKITMHSHAM